MLSTVVRRKKMNIYITCTALMLLAATALWAFDNNIATREYTIETGKLVQGSNIRIVMLSDLHSHIYGNNQDVLVSMIRKQNPDIIALAGDIADNAEPVDGMKLLLEGIKDAAPIYYVTGNHEYWSQSTEKVFNLLKKYDVNILSDTYETVDIKGQRIIISGINDPERRRRRNLEGVIKDSLSTVSESAKIDGFSILLSHRPEYANLYKKYDYDLILCGHTHGGQFRLPLILNGLYAPNQGFFPKYAGGRYDLDNSTMIVSRGLSNTVKLPRIFNPPEINVINVAGRRD